MKNFNLDSRNCFVTQGDETEPAIVLPVKEGMVINVKLDSDGNLIGHYANAPIPDAVTRVLRASSLQDKEGRTVSALHYHYLEGLFAQFDQCDAEWYLIDPAELVEAEQLPGLLERRVRAVLQIEPEELVTRAQRRDPFALDGGEDLHPARTVPPRAVRRRRWPRP